MNVLLDDVIHEVNVLLMEQPEEERRVAKIYIPATPALEEFQRLLGCRNCKISLLAQKFLPV